MALMFVSLARRFSREVVGLRRYGKDLVGDAPRRDVLLGFPVCALPSLCDVSRRLDRPVMLGEAGDNDEWDEAD